MFRRLGGRLKVTKRGREAYLLLLADTIKEPDEIWWRYWVKFDGDTPAVWKPRGL